MQISEKNMKNKNKIGLLSLSNAENYGAVLQCYSLLKYCKIINKQVEVINYFPSFMKGRYKLFWLNKSSLRAFLGSCKNAIRILPFSGIKKIKFHNFRRKYLRNTILGRVYSLVDNYDKYIVGSDQVWNLRITNYDMAFFLDFVNDKKKKNSYAASLGIDNFETSEKIILFQYMCGFNNISIREKKTSDYFTKIANEKRSKMYIETNIDPVFLISKEEWRKIYKKFYIKEKYILVYAFESLDKAIDFAKNLAKKYSYVIYIIRCTEDKYYNGIRCLRIVGPLEFLSLIDNAEYIITDSFHGTAFSMIFRKNFYTIPYKGTNSRIENILGIFNLSNRLINNINNRYDVSIDYSDFEPILCNEISKSKLYLNNILND